MDCGFGLLSAEPAAGGGAGMYTTLGPVCRFGHPPNKIAILHTKNISFKVSSRYPSARNNSGATRQLQHLLSRGMLHGSFRGKRLRPTVCYEACAARRSREILIILAAIAARNLCLFPLSIHPPSCAISRCHKLQDGGAKMKHVNEPTRHYAEMI